MDNQNAFVLKIQDSRGISLRTLFSRFYVLAVVLLPVLLPYRFLLTSYSFGSMLGVILAFSAVFFIAFNLKKIRPLSIIFLIAFFIYAMFKNSGMNRIYFLVIILALLPLTTNYFDTKFMRKSVEIISVVASVFVILQILVFYVFKRHIPMVFLNLCTDSINTQYTYLASTGLDGSNYRPSAFFLEPAYFSQFAIFGLASCLFRKKSKMIMAIIISLGIIATTSGMGIIVLLVAWLSWIIFCNAKWIKMNVGKFVILLVVALVALILVYQIPFVKFAVGRILGTDGGNSAIKGRLFFWDAYFGGLTFSDLFPGYGISSIPENVYFTSFMEYLWAYGVIGVALFFAGCLQLFIRSKSLSRFLILIVVLLTFFANQTNIAAVVFNFGAILVLKEESYKI